MARRRVWWAVALVALIAASCDGAASPSQPTSTTSTLPAATSPTVETSTTSTTRPGVPFVVAGILPTVGALERFGTDMSRALLLVSEELERAGGIPGFRLELVMLDGSDRSSAESSARRAVEEGSVALIGGVSVETASAIASVAAETGLLVLAPTLGSLEGFDATPQDGLIRIRPDVAAEGRALADLVASTSGNVVVLLEPTAASRAVAARLEASLSGRSVELQELPLEEGELSSLAAAAGATAVVCVCRAGPRLDELLADATRSGLLALDWFFGSEVLDPTLPARVFPDDLGALAGFRGVVGAGPSGPAYDSFAAAFTARFGDPPGTFVAEAYDAAWLAVLAVAAVGPGGDLLDAVTEAASVGTRCSGAACLAAVVKGDDIDYVGASGDVDLGPDGVPPDAPYRVWRFTADGRVEFLDG